VDVTSVAILVVTVEFNEPVPLNVNVDALEVDGFVVLGVVAFEEGDTIGL
jgi:hypothetical protein